MMRMLERFALWRSDRHAHLAEIWLGRAKRWRDYVRSLRAAGGRG